MLKFKKIEFLTLCILVVFIWAILLFLIVKAHL